MSTTAPTPPASQNHLSHKEIVEVLVGLLSGLFVALMSTTIVSTALPTIIGDLHGTQTQYTWVVTASLLAMTVTGPIWSKFADLFNKKLLVQVAIVVFALGSVAAGAVQNVPELLAARAVQGLGMGGLIAMTQAILGTIIPPRERGRYSGYMAATMAVATVSGPLLGGLIVDSLGWRWCFWVGVPFTVVALVMLQRFLTLPPLPRREVSIDWFGALFITVAAALPMLWVSFAGSSYAWWSSQTLYFAVGTLVALALAVVVERRHREPLVPPRILTEKTTVLAVIASLAVGIAQFGASVFLSQYFQLARSHTPTQAGLLMLPLIAGSMVGSTFTGQFITRTGEWKKPMLVGTVLLIVGLTSMGFIDHTTPLWHLSGLMILMGLGTGALMQNLVLVVQNTVDVTDIGAASGVVSFFRSLGGAVGVAALGAVLANSVKDHIATGVRSAIASGHVSPRELGAMHGGGNLDIKAMPAALQEIVHQAYADATGRIFLIAGLIAIVSLVAVALLPRTELRSTIRKEAETDESASAGETKVPEPSAR